MLLGGYLGEETVHFGDKALRLPAKNAPEAVVRIVRSFADERQAGEAFRGRDPDVNALLRVRGFPVTPE